MFGKETDEMKKIQHKGWDKPLGPVVQFPIINFNNLEQVEPLKYSKKWAEGRVNTQEFKVEDGDICAFAVKFWLPLTLHKNPIRVLTSDKKYHSEMEIIYRRENKHKATILGIYPSYIALSPRSEDKEKLPPVIYKVPHIAMKHIKYILSHKEFDKYNSCDFKEKDIKYEESVYPLDVELDFSKLTAINPSGYEWARSRDTLMLDYSQEVLTEDKLLGFSSTSVKDVNKNGMLEFYDGELGENRKIFFRNSDGETLFDIVYSMVYRGLKNPYITILGMFPQKINLGTEGANIPNAIYKIPDELKEVILYLIDNRKVKGHDTPKFSEDFYDSGYV